MRLNSRYRRIVFFFARLVGSLALWEIILPKLGLSRWAKQTRSERLRKAAIRFRTLAIRMGGVMIKVGQFLSTRVDVLPPEFTDELTGLQDEVPEEPFTAIRQVAEKELGITLERKFAYFEEKPLAAASLGQAHRARLWLEQDGAETHQLAVVVKVQRPGIENIIATDLAALRTVGDWLRRYRPFSKRMDIPALIEEFSKILGEEVDYLAEGVHAETFALNFQDVPGVSVPRVIWSHTTRRVLTLEDVGGIKINDYAALAAAGIDSGEVAERLLDTYLKQIFEDGFFHADPHPGNLFVNPLPDGEWELAFVDFGMVGRVPPDMRLALRELLAGVGTQDAARVVHASQLMGVLLPSADLKLIEKAEKRLFERFWGKNMSELRDISPAELNKLSQEFRELLYDLPFQVPQNLIFLGRTVGILSGMCTGLDAQFNVWYHLAPYAERMVSQEAAAFGPSFLLQELGNWAQKLASLPQRTQAMLERVERGELVVRDEQLTEQVRLTRRTIQRAALSIIFAALLLSSVQLYLGGEPQLSGALAVGAAVSLIAALRG